MTSNVSLSQRPWENEPDKVSFKYHGYDCLIRRNPNLETLCGYVAIPKGNRFYNIDDTNPICDDLQVWGGLTFCGHLPKRAEFYLGFDCAHAQDLVPASEKLHQMMHPNQQYVVDPSVTYKDVNFVKSELHSLVDQIIKLS